MARNDVAVGVVAPGEGNENPYLYTPYRTLRAGAIA